MSSRLAVLFTGAIAGLLVARAALAYRGVDPLALGLVLLIGAGLAVGVIEGFVRGSRAESLLREARALPEPATLDAVEKASPPLRTFLEARIAGAPAVVTSAPFTPYLLGLLVMIGLLGTFLGLFETLRGAREALSASGDIATLRAGMAAPMTGLSRAFGTSATGVSASAMLGLGAVFVRRAEGRVAAVIGRYATTTLAPLTLAGRQLAALTALATSGEALPSAVLALTQSNLLVERLSEQLSAAHERSAEAVLVAQRQAAADAAEAIRAGAADVRADLDKGIARAADAVTAAAQPLLTETVAKVSAAVGGALEGLIGRLDDDARAKIERDVEHLAALTALAKEATTGLAKGATETFAATAAELARGEAARAAELARREDARAAALHGSLEEVVAATARMGAAQAAHADARGLADEARAAKLAAALERAVTAVDDAEARAESRETARARDAESRIESLVTVFAAQLESVSGQLADPLRRAAQAAEASVATAAKLVQGAQEQLGAEAREAAARGAQLDAVITTLGAVAARVAEDAAAKTSLLETLARTLDTRTQTAEERAEARTTRLTEAVESTVRELAERHGAYETRLLAERGEVTQALADRLALHAQGLDESLRITAGTVGEASQLLRSGGAELVSVAEMFTAAVDRYRDASDRWLENLGAIEDAISRKEGGGDVAALLGSYVAQTREVFDHSLQFQRELFTELRALRGQRPPSHGEGAEGSA
jgi:hypothetical protein